jgi:hypothetical protein
MNNLAVHGELRIKLRIKKGYLFPGMSVSNWEAGNDLWAGRTTSKERQIRGKQ